MTSYISGGDFSTAQKPLKRKFPVKGNKRQVRVRTTVFDGVGHHYHTTVREQDNPILCRCADADEMHEHSFWKDPDVNGKIFSQSFDTIVESYTWVRKIWDENFNHRTHVLVEDEGLHERVKWFYKEGD